MDMKNFLRSIFERPIAYYPIFARIMGSVAGGVLLSQLMYWWSYYGEEFYISDEELRSQTFLSKRELQYAKERLKELPFVKVSRKGMPARTFYDIDVEKFQEYITNLMPNNSKGVNAVETSWNTVFQQVGTQCSNKLEHSVPTGDEKVVESQSDTKDVIAYIYKTNNEIKYETTADYSWNTSAAAEDEGYVPKYMDSVDIPNSDILFKLTNWKRYDHPSRKGVKTTIRQMVMDIVCINRLRRELFPEEEKVVAQIQRDLNEGKLTYEKFAEVYKRWELSNIPRIGWLVSALYNGNENDLKELENKLNEVKKKINNEKNAEIRLKIFNDEYKPLIAKINELKGKKK